MTTTPIPASITKAALVVMYQSLQAAHDETVKRLNAFVQAAAMIDNAVVQRPVLFNEFYDNFVKMVLGQEHRRFTNEYIDRTVEELKVKHTAKTTAAETITWQENEDNILGKPIYSAAEIETAAQNKGLDPDKCTTAFYALKEALLNANFGDIEEHVAFSGSKYATMFTLFMQKPEKYIDIINEHGADMCLNALEHDTNHEVFQRTMGLDSKPLDVNGPGFVKMPDTFPEAQPMAENTEQPFFNVAKDQGVDLKNLYIFLLPDGKAEIRKHEMFPTKEALDKLAASSDEKTLIDNTRKQVTDDAMKEFMTTVQAIDDKNAAKLENKPAIKGTDKHKQAIKDYLETEGMIAKRFCQLNDNPFNFFVCSVLESTLTVLQEHRIKYMMNEAGELKGMIQQPSELETFVKETTEWCKANAEAAMKDTKEKLDDYAKQHLQAISDKEPNVAKIADVSEALNMLVEQVYNINNARKAIEAGMPHLVGALNTLSQSTTLAKTIADKLTPEETSLAKQIDEAIASIPVVGGFEKVVGTPVTCKTFPVPPAGQNPTIVGQLNDAFKDMHSAANKGDEKKTEPDKQEARNYSCGAETKLGRTHVAGGGSIPGSQFDESLKGATFIIPIRRPIGSDPKSHLFTSIFADKKKGKKADKKKGKKKNK